MSKHNLSNAGPSATLSPATAALLDVFSVDNHLLQVFVVPKVVALFRLFVHDSDGSALSRLLQTAALPLMQILTFLCTRGQTPAVKLLDLQLTMAPSSSSFSPSPLDANKNEQANEVPLCRLLVYAMVRFVTPVLLAALKSHTKRQNYQEKANAGTSVDVNCDYGQEALMEQKKLTLAYQRQYTVARVVIRIMDRLVPVAQLSAMLSCWCGATNTSDMLMILTGLSYRNNNSGLNPHEPKLHVTYAHNRWLGEQTVETVKMILLSGFTLSRVAWSPVWQLAILDPLLNIHKRIRDCIQKKNSLSLGNEVCPICRRVPSTIPVQTNCGHMYCYTCLYLHEQQHSRDSYLSRRFESSQSDFRCKLCGEELFSARSMYLT